MTLRRLLLVVPLIAGLAVAPTASARSTPTAIKKAYSEVLAAVDAVYNANGAAELVAAATRLERACGRGGINVRASKPRGSRQKRARRLALRGLRKCGDAADLFARAAKHPGGQQQQDLRAAGERALRQATDLLDRAVKLGGG